MDYDPISLRFAALILCGFGLSCSMVGYLVGNHRGFKRGARWYAFAPRENKISPIQRN